MIDEPTPKPVKEPALGGDYPNPRPTATSSLGEILREKIRSGGLMGFPAFMATALYHPELGYYARGTSQTGRSGDFFTSVSVGPLFGHILARRFLRHWEEEKRPNPWRIIELGAHDGTLARDILGSLRQLNPLAFGGLEYVIAEPLPALRLAQQQTLAGFAAQTRLVADLSAVAQSPLPGLAFGNEVLDALPFHTLVFSGGRWMERAVGLSGDGRFTWETRDIADRAVEESIQPAGTAFPEGYLTETRTGYADFLAPIAAALVRPLMIWPDYGFASPEFLHPDRRGGTLRTFRRHTAGENPLENPGEADITAHVDFTAVTRAAMTLGARPLAFKSQGAWIGEHAREWLLEQEGAPNMPLLRQFQTLTHPGHLGAAFQVLELTWDTRRTPDDPGLLDHRLAIPGNLTPGYP